MEDGMTQKPSISEKSKTLFSVPAAVMPRIFHLAFWDTWIQFAVQKTMKIGQNQHYVGLLQLALAKMLVRTFKD